MHVKLSRLPVIAVTLAGSLAALPAVMAPAPGAVAAVRPAVPLVTLGHGQGMSSGPAADPLPPSSSVIEPDYTTTTQSIWAGWADVADTNVALRYVTANFVVPTVSCPGAGYDAAFWVGLDGDQEGSTVEQVGVDAYCDIKLPSGGYAPDYTSWWEMYPGGVHTKGNVSPGDTIAVAVYYDSSTGKYSLALSDSKRTGPDISTSQPCPGGYTCHNKTAEVIAEDSGGGPSKGVYLAKFSKVTFSQVGVTSRDGTHGTLEGNSLWSSNELKMAYQGHAMATPSAREDGATEFSVTWNGSG
jgi:Peptidase A4 family